jgi:beta-phosphoglucomutase-like phosphatase (HAD superfamily)
MMKSESHEVLPLEMVRRHLEAAPGIALIDIDSTIMDTAPRNLAILRAAAAEEFPELRDAEELMDPEALGWNLTSALSGRLRLTGERSRKLHLFWKERFFTGAWLEHDTPYPGAASFLRQLQEFGARLVYFTGRNYPDMAEGTIESFGRHGIPFADLDDFIFKPTPHEDDLSFKERILKDISSRGEVVFGLENEPANANRMHRAFPDALILFIDTITSDRPEPLDRGIIRFRRYP